MIATKLMFFAEGVIRDVDTQVISIFNIIETITAPRFPILMPRLSIFSLIEKDVNDPEDYKCQIKLSLGGNELFDQPIDVNFAGTLRNRVTLNVNGLAVPEPGLLEAKLIFDEKVIGSYSIQVNAVPEKKVSISKN